MSGAALKYARLLVVLICGFSMSRSAAQTYLDSLIQRQRELQEQEALQHGESGREVSRDESPLWGGRTLSRGETREFERQQREERKRREQRAWRVRSVDFYGNSAYGKRDLQSLMELKRKSRFTEYMMRSDLDALTAFYKNGGFEYVSVKFVSERDSASRKVNIHISVEEGRRIHVGEINIDVRRFAPGSGAMRKLVTRRGAPLVHSDVRQDCRTLKEIAGERGFLEAIVEPEVMIDTVEYRASVVFRVQEGPVVKVGNINIDARKFRRVTVERELSIRKGDTLNLRTVRQSERNLYTTGLFNYVHIKPEFDTAVAAVELPDSVYDLSVRVTRGEYVRAQAGLGYSTDEGARVSASATWKNMFALGQSLTLSSKVSQVSQGAEAVHAIPWFLYTPLQLNTKLYYTRFDRPRLYEGFFDGVRVSLGRQSNHDILYQVWSQWEDVSWIEPPTQDNVLAGVPNDPTQSIGGDIAYDIRNDLFSPTKGGFIRLGVELAGVFGGKSNQFVKTTFDSRVYFTGRSRYHLSMAARTGYAMPYGKSADVPPQSKFYGGGSTTVRGFPVDKLAVLPNDDPLLGNFYVFLNVADVRVPMFWWIHRESFLNWFNAAAFIDAGNVWPNFEDIASAKEFFGGLRWTAGPGLRVDTPIKLVARLDFGFKIDRRPRESVYEIHFDLGQPF
ncbi:MAG: BamA/TamA family outer membrane protein [Chitinispirillales bacterium]|jgi:outer membrane protein assembly complex protein YaeT|nr:BamA/TamA family outer membrane protein [Chitinispirillales bacterium]